MSRPGDQGLLHELLTKKSMSRLSLRKGKGWCATALVLIAFAAVPARALAETADDSPATKRARELYSEGKEAYRAGDYKKAVRAFREADQLKSGTPELLHVLGMAEVRAEAYADGANHLAAWLRAVPGAADDRKIAEPLLKAAEARVGCLKLSAQPSGAVINIDQGRQAERNVPLYVEPGEHLIVASLGARKDERRVTIGAGQLITVELVVPAAPEAVAAPPQRLTPPAVAPASGPPTIAAKQARHREAEGPPPEAYARAVVLSLGVGATFAGLAFGTDRISRGDAGSYRAEALIGFGAAGVAGLATAAGIIWWPAWHSTSRSTSLNIQPVPGGLTAFGQF